MNDSDYAIELENITKTFGSVVANRNINLNVKQGEILALLGENGSGKTTLMKMIAGLTKQTSGEITLDGIPVGPETKKHIAYMPTESYFYSYMSIADAGKGGFSTTQINYIADDTHCVIEFILV